MNLFLTRSTAFLPSAIRGCLFNALLVLATGPVLAQPATQLILKTGINSERASFGSELTVRIALTNSGRHTATNLIVQGSLPPFVGSTRASVGTGQPHIHGGFAQQHLTDVASLAGGQGLTPNLCSILPPPSPATWAKVYTSVPLKVCAGTGFAFVLTLLTGQSSCQ